MRKLQIYLDTSVISFAVSTQDVEIKKKATLTLLEQIRENKFDAYISGTVLREIEKASESKRKELYTMLESIPFVELEMTEEVDILADRYVEVGIIPAKYIDDALHLAVASVNNMNVVVSWNFNHLVKVKTRREVRGLNALVGYGELDIATPEEVIEDERAQANARDS